MSSLLDDYSKIIIECGLKCDLLIWGGFGMGVSTKNLKVYAFWKDWPVNDSDGHIKPLDVGDKVSLINKKEYIITKITREFVKLPDTNPSKSIKWWNIDIKPIKKEGISA